MEYHVQASFPPKVLYNGASFAYQDRDLYCWCTDWLVLYYYWSLVITRMAKAPFDAKAAKSALGSFIEEYTCANNFFNCDLEFNVDPNVTWLEPWHEIKLYFSYHYKEAAVFAEPFEVCVPASWVNSMAKHDLVKPIIPLEHRIAFVLPLGHIPLSLDGWRVRLDVGYCEDQGTY